MRIFSIIPALAALVTAFASVSVHDTCTGAEMRREPHVAPKRGFAGHPSRNVHSMTNAELPRRELPLNRPVLRRGTFVTSSTEIYTRSGLTQMEVRFLLSLCILIVALIRLAAYPDQQVWTQSTGLYVGGSMDGYHDRYPSLVTPVVSPC